ncbi:MAG: hypothetical protein E6H66_21110 [Betaproteobacteria bacterium]|nr:MAG: hypothetical protein E6H66_21110 [Betaproteobacteria bacterium]
MTTSAVGRVVDEHLVGIPDLAVVLHDVSQQFDVKLGKPDETIVTDDQGKFSLTYVGYPYAPSEPGKQVRRLRLRVMLGQHVLRELVQDDVLSQDKLTFADIHLTREESKTWWATLGTGTASRKTDGNAIRWLADDEDAWDRVAKVIEAAGRSGAKLDVMQLTIDASKFQPDKLNDPCFLREKPFVVLNFNANDKIVDKNFVLDHLDARIERSIVEAYQKGADVRIQLPKPTLDKHGLVVAGTAILGIASLILLGGVVALIVELLFLALGAVAAFLLVYFRKEHLGIFHTLDIIQWFGDAGPAPNRLPVNVKQLKMHSNQYTHAKLVIDHEREALLLGSPFEQQYFDSLQHDIDNPRRGRDASKGPIHDVSVGVRGPAVAHLREMFNLHWNLADPDHKELPVRPDLPGPVTSADSNEFTTTVQVVRTLDAMFSETFDPPNEKGEQGVLESYLRAIHFAERFIYIENQYFNNDTITEALIEALRNKKKLKIILLVNATPDMPLYLGWQQKATARIAEAAEKLRKTEGGTSRFGAFAAWTHAAPNNDHTNPRLVDNYLHTKSAIVDNRWAAVGSANLDGASLDSIQYARSMFGGDIRNSEANVVVWEETDAPSPAVDALRRRLWAEHLGFADPKAHALDDTADRQDWLDVWNETAKKKLDGFNEDINKVLGHDGPSVGNQIHILACPTHEYGEDLHFWNRHHSHAAAYSYLKHLFTEDKNADEADLVRFEILDESGPQSFPFTYK